MSPVQRCATRGLLALAALVSLPGGSRAQTWWRVPAGAGGAMVGAGVGWLLDVVVWSSNTPDPFTGPSLVGTPLGMGLGGLLGFAGGLGADRRLARGDTLTRRARGTLRIATFLAPVAVGSAIAFAVINPSEEGRCVPYTGPDPNIICTFEAPKPKAMSDESVALLAIGGGVVLGFVAQHRFKSALWPGTRLGMAPNGRGLMLSVPAGW